MSHAIFAAAYLEEFDGLCDYMEKAGSGDPDFTSEKRAAFGLIMANIEDDDDYAFMDKMADAELTSLEKVAIRAQLGRYLLGRGAAQAARGARSTARGQKMLEKAYKPTASFSRRFQQKGWSPERIQSVYRGYKTMGPRGWMRMRRATSPAFAGPSAAGGAAAAAAGKAHPISRMPWTGLEKLKAGKDIGMAGMATQELKRRASRDAARKAARRQAQVGKTTRQRAAAGAGKGKGKGKGKAGANGDAEGKGIWPSVKSGLLWGGGFGAAQRVLAPEEGPEYVLGSN
jgi:hypothetical protein